MQPAIAQLVERDYRSAGRPGRRALLQPDPVAQALQLAAQQPVNEGGEAGLAKIIAEDRTVNANGAGLGGITAPVGQTIGAGIRVNT